MDKLEKYNDKVQITAKYDGLMCDIEVNVWADTKGGISGCFEMYDINTSGEYIYAEGGLWFDRREPYWFEDKEVIFELVDYDGVYELPKLILYTLKDHFGIDVDEHLSDVIVFKKKK